ncbi:leucine-rich repeat neuronal protein 1 [Octopus bimaculoides]|uniref:Ig-like domain-containing protein n=1 Tax=Octopus bimaculoides TaxID=37653 RepID=A0A0L8G287_OCTBM|nr:leucine-rich repeat neuronal protein 1 [Octopus bimaculoides]XP_014784823.1 leucine-rich repeat neuronal protein 1 [Octopus bimaculoides]|eukprot:XP_014784822.1 PREDICTED: leucine-rich repeat neuronal protein 1-like [Octopus bimaculoides]
MRSPVYSLLGVLSLITIINSVHGITSNRDNITSNQVLAPNPQPIRDNPLRSPWTTHCAINCTCDVVSYANYKNLKTINCSNINLVSMPNISNNLAQAFLLSKNKFKIVQELPHLKNLKILDLSSSQISKFNSHWQFFLYGLLEELNLHNNLLKTLQDGAFTGLKNLRVLDLSYNRLHLIEKDAFGGLNNLQVLNLDGNGLTSVNPDWFQRIKSVSELLLSKNDLRKLTDDLFRELPLLSTLNLTGNQIRVIEVNAFRGLSKLCVLNLSNNRLTNIPSQEIRFLPSLDILILDANSFETVKSEEFHHLNISELSLSFLPLLKSIQNNSFHHLPKLTILQMHDNKNLLFIHPNAFSQVPNLQKLYLHNNKLWALPYTLKASLPNCTNIHLYHNPLRCDCNIHWIIKELASTGNKSRIQFHDANKIICDFSNNKTLLSEIRMNEIPESCPPTTLPSFPKHFETSIGEPISLECLAIGVPLPQIHWLVGKGAKKNQTNPEKQAEINNGLYYVRFARLNNSGSYKCVAENIKGNDTRSASVEVLSGRLNIITGKTSNTYITIILNGSESLMLLDKYQIHYKESVKDSEYNVIYLKSRMHRCTITGLKPHTMYELCILYQINSELLKLHCINVTTKLEGDKSGITKIVDVKVVMGIIVAISVTLTVICFIAVAKRFRKRKEYEEPFGHDRMEPLSHIPLENLYHPPSTPICSSRTSLISHSQA